MMNDNLTIEAICLATSPGHAVHTESYLDALSETKWASLRAEATLSLIPHPMLARRRTRWQQPGR
jgi:hypothetical protein